MSDPTLAVNDIIQIGIPGGAGTRHTYTSRVEDVRDAAYVVAWPTGDEGLLELSTPQIVNLFYVRDRTVWMIEGHVREAVAAPLPVLVVEPIGSARRVERRDDFRVRTPVHVALTEKVVSLSSFKHSREISSVKAYTATLSAGGFTIRHAVPMAIGTLVDVSLTLPDKAEPLNVSARVVRCSLHPRTTDGRFEIGFAFSHIPESARAHLVRFVFRAQIAEISTDV
jgi:c-di-GMP-binding flagellar brake protein YcgR